MKLWIGNLLALSALCQSGLSQGFSNLDFESAQIIPVTSGSAYIESASALPNWTVYIGNNQQSEIAYNTIALGSTAITLLATNGQQISGNYSVLLEGNAMPYSASIAQTGIVPVSAASLLFEAQAGNGTLEVALGGQILSFSALSTGSNYILYGAAIPAGMAGQSEQLEFSALQYAGGFNNWNLDNIQFSTSAVPEPSVIGLIGLGGLFIGWHRWKRYSA